MNFAFHPLRIVTGAVVAICLASSMLRAQTLISLGAQTENATAINDEGQVVGSAFDSSGDLQAFLYTNGTLTDLGTLVVCPANK